MIDWLLAATPMFIGSLIGSVVGVILYEKYVRHKQSTKKTVLNELVVKISADTTEFRRSMSQVAAETEKLMKAAQALK